MLRRTLSCLAVLTLGGSGLALWTASPAASGPVAPAITVDTTVDDGDLDECTAAPDDCSLRGALLFAEIQDHSVVTDVTVPAGADLDPVNSDYLLTDDALHVDAVNVNVHGAGVGATVVGIDRATDDPLIRHLYLHGGDGDVIVTISDMTFEGGNGDQNTAQGGSIYAALAELTVLRMHFVDNTVRGNGGAIVAQGDPNVDTLHIEDTTFVGNSATEHGGAIYVGAEESAEISNSTFTDNVAAFGGGVAVGVVDPGDSGGIARLTHVTMSGNASAGMQGDADTSGGSLFVGPGSEAQLEGTLLEASVEGEVDLGDAGAADPGDPADECHVADSAVLESQGFNVIDDDSCDVSEEGDQQEVAGDAQPLADNGGPTHTMALLADSPAVDAAGATCDVADDQRGVTRPQDGNDDGTNGCDAGAFELAAAPAEEPEPEEPPAAQPAEVVPTFTG